MRVYHHFQNSWRGSMRLVAVGGGLSPPPPSTYESLYILSSADVVHSNAVVVGADQDMSLCRFDDGFLIEDN